MQTNPASQPATQQSTAPGTTPPSTTPPVVTAAPTPTEAGPTASPAATTTATAATGAAGSLVYIVGNNVWLAAPDGSRARQLTTDGTRTNGYHDPSQTDDGRIFALRGTRALIQVDRQGQPVGAPVSLNTLENGAEALAAAPDGSLLAYVTTGYGTEIDPRFGTPSGTFLYGGTDVVDLQGKSIDLAAAANLLFPFWVDEGHLVGSDGVDLYADTVAPGEPQKWVSYDDGCLIELDCPAGREAAASLSSQVLSRTGGVLTYSYRPYFGPAGRRMATVAADPPALPMTRCVVPGQETYSDAGTFAPDGSQFAYDDRDFNPETFETVVGQGIWLMRVDLDAADCGVASAKLVIPGGSQPEWGPAAP